jgi:four helix bundle protein
MEKDITERSFQFAVRIVKLCEHLDSSTGVSRTLANQLLRAGTSIGANVEEAQAGQSKADFISKLSIANKEARETLYWLKLLIASEIVEESKLLPLCDEANQLVSILTTIIKNARENSELGMKDKERKTENA